MAWPKEIERIVARRSQQADWESKTNQLLDDGKLRDRELEFVMSVKLQLQSRGTLTEKQYEYLDSLWKRDQAMKRFRQTGMSERSLEGLTQFVEGLMEPDANVTSAPINDWVKEQADEFLRQQQEQERQQKPSAKQKQIGFIPGKPKRLIKLDD